MSCVLDHALCLYLWGKMMRKNSNQNLLQKQKFRFNMLVFCLIGLLLSACSQTATHVGAFSQASEDLVEQTITAYDLLNESSIDRNIYDIAAEPPVLPDDDTFLGLFDRNDSLRIRMKALKLLQSYTIALGELSAASFREDIDKAAADIYGALTGLRDSYQEAKGETLDISNESLAIVSTAFNAIATSVTEKKRREAMKVVILEADPVIQSISALLKEELPIFIEYATANLASVESEMILAYRKESPGLDFQGRVLFLEKIRVQNKKKLGAASFFEDASKAAGILGKAHHTLRNAVEKNKFTTPELVKQIGQLSGFAKSMKMFYDELDT